MTAFDGLFCIGIASCGSYRRLKPPTHPIECTYPVREFCEYVRLGMVQLLLEHVGEAVEGQREGARRRAYMVVTDVKDACVPACRTTL